uniref:Bud22 domain-containing protein n=1 Tax=Polytomella parva TaxID=51329 RepID=A0A7S0VI78_9CHLO|mmetsp:Transcript_33783/g.60998  ORF Transcript_33783/g.60998 Transcript_33783/m.60998 type:complete len:575 (+) Transcript_33783:72-1796(+)
MTRFIKKYIKKGKKAASNNDKDEQKKRYVFHCCKQLHKALKLAKQFEAGKISRRLAGKNDSAEEASKLEMQLKVVKSFNIGILVNQAATTYGFSQELIAQANYCAPALPKNEAAQEAAAVLAAANAPVEMRKTLEERLIGSNVVKQTAESCLRTMMDKFKEKKGNKKDDSTDNKEDGSKKMPQKTTFSDDEETGSEDEEISKSESESESAKDDSSDDGNDDSDESSDEGNDEMRLRNTEDEDYDEEAGDGNFNSEDFDSFNSSATQTKKRKRARDEDDEDESDDDNDEDDDDEDGVIDEDALGIESESDGDESDENEDEKEPKKRIGSKENSGTQEKKVSTRTPDSPKREKDKDKVTSKSKVSDAATASKKQKMEPEKRNLSEAQRQEQSEVTRKKDKAPKLSYKQRLEAKLKGSDRHLVSATNGSVRNRLGQRARRKLAEELYGSMANHLLGERKGKEGKGGGQSKWGDKGKNEGSYNKDSRYGKSAGLDSYGKTKQQKPYGKDNERGKPYDKREDYNGKSNNRGKDFGSKRQQSQESPAAAPETLHPSWQAKLKNKPIVITDKPASKKIVFE